MNPAPALVICMGVSGCGKSTVAAGLAREFDIEFIEADDFHPPENRARMAAGMPLTDAMREPWIASLCRDLVKRANKPAGLVLAFSGLRRAHRQRFREVGFRTLFLHLQSDGNIIAERLNRRSGHYMPASLLESQFDAMESAAEEADVVAVDCAGTPEEVLKTCTRLTREFLHRNDEPRVSIR